MDSISRNEQDGLLRRAWAGRSSSSASVPVHGSSDVFRILAHSAIQLYIVRNGAWEAIASGVVGLIAFGKVVENARMVVFSSETTSLVFDEAIANLLSYEVWKRAHFNR
jgi:hypothetical protein